MNLPRPLRFDKMHGAGNDFVVIDLRGGLPVPSPDLVRALGDRHTGVGFDQLLTIEDSARHDTVARYGIWNTDGTAAQQCGNGARCVAAWVQREGIANGRQFRLDSPAGVVDVQRLDDGRYEVSMGRPVFRPSQVPLLADIEALQYTLRAGDDEIHFGAVSLGNPHAVLEVASVDETPVHRLGPLMQSRLEFPEGVNVGFAQVLTPQRIRLRVYERGVGETLACGSGACAAVAVLARQGRVDRHVFVYLPGGSLEVRWPADDAPITMAGPTAFVFEGQWR